MAGGKRLTFFVNGLTRKVRQRAAKTHAPPAMPMNVLSVLSLCREMNSRSGTAHKMPSILSRSEAHGGASTTGNGLTSHVDFGPGNLSVWDLTVSSWKK